MGFSVPLFAASQHEQVNPSRPLPYPPGSRDTWFQQSHSRAGFYHAALYCHFFRLPARLRDRTDSQAVAAAIAATGFLKQARRSTFTSASALSRAHSPMRQT